MSAAPSAAPLLLSICAKKCQHVYEEISSWARAWQTLGGRGLQSVQESMRKLRHLVPQRFGDPRQCYECSQRRTSLAEKAPDKPASAPAAIRACGLPDLATRSSDMLHSSSSHFRVKRPVK